MLDRSLCLSPGSRQPTTAEQEFLCWSFSCKPQGQPPALVLDGEDAGEAVDCFQSLAGNSPTIACLGPELEPRNKRDCGDRESPAGANRSTEDRCDELTKLRDYLVRKQPFKSKAIEYISHLATPNRDDGQPEPFAFIANGPQREHVESLAPMQEPVPGCQHIVQVAFARKRRRDH